MIAICTPTRGLVHARFAYDLAELIRRSPGKAIFAFAEGSLLGNLRTQLVESSLKAGMSHVLFIDSDMNFPADSLERLLRRDVDIVGVNAPQRGNSKPTARSNGLPCHGSGLAEVDTIGFGLTMIRTDIFRKVPKPWFAMPWDGQKFVGEDVYFCARARARGFKIFVDHDLKVGHIGDFVFTLQC